MDEGGLPIEFGHDYLSDLLDLTQAMGVARDPQTGSRVLYRAIEAVFQSALKHIEEEYPDLWASIVPEGHRLHDLFYRVPNGTRSGAADLLDRA